MEIGRRDMKRGGGTNRFSKKQSESENKLKKRRRMLKKQQEEEEDKSYEFSPPSDLETELSCKKTNLLKKNLKDISNGVNHHHHHHASIPRKLRSAMKKKKRNLESVSKLTSASKRLNRLDLIKKEDQEMEVAKSTIISKDEKEVAETLFGLAGMFTEAAADTIDKKTLSSEKEISKAAEKTDSTNLDPVNVTNATVTAHTSNGETDYKSNGVGLWPGLSSTIQSDSYNLLKLPPWMGQAVSTSDSVSHLTEPLRVEPKKLNKCASHIYIARLIKVLQTGRKNTPKTHNQTETSQCGIPDPPKRYQDPNFRDRSRTHNPKTTQEGMMTQIALDLYGPHTLQKQSSQSYDFLSLSSTGVASFPQYPYQAGRFQTAYAANQQQQQLQKRLWAASHYRPPTRTNITSNQYSKPSLSLNLTSTSIQPLQVASSSRYINNVSQQQQQHHRLMAAMSHHHHNNLSRTVMNRQEHYFPLIYEDSRTPLQLLCNEHS